MLDSNYLSNTIYISYISSEGNIEVQGRYEPVRGTAVDFPFRFGFHRSLVWKESLRMLLWRMVTSQC